VIPARDSELTTACETPRSANDSVDMHNSLAAHMSRGRFGRRRLTRTADCGTQASCLAADDAGRSHQPSSSFSRLRAKTSVAQARLRALELPFKLLQPSVRANTPPVQLGSQKRDPIVVVVRLGLQLLDLVARRAHA